MHWLVDESKSFIYQTPPLKIWKLAVVCAAALPYEGRKSWLAKRKHVGKGYLKEQEICAIS